ncbi:MAG: molybdenum cofactor guanylyltransferase [Candidatus Bipolaricaulota bacterium]|nr:molybdenum cofactor guanylyltransferase [Candidatus Bipolaricaulota bacterium]
MSEDTTLIILAGGESRRMSKPKHLLLTAAGRTLIENLHERLSPMFTDSIVVGNDPDLTRFGIRTVRDLYPLHSPLVGIYSGLIASRSELCFVVACDMPFIDGELIQRLLSRASGSDIAVPIVGGYYEPLCAAYRRSTIPTIHAALDRGTLKVTDIYKHLRVRELGEHIIRQIDPELSSFINLNTPRELALLKHI